MYADYLNSVLPEYNNELQDTINNASETLNWIEAGAEKRGYESEHLVNNLQVDNVMSHQGILEGITPITPKVPGQVTRQIFATATHRIVASMALPNKLINQYKNAGNKAKIFELLAKLPEMGATAHRLVMEQWLWTGTVDPLYAGLFADPTALGGVFTLSPYWTSGLLPDMARGSLEDADPASQTAPIYRKASSVAQGWYNQRFLFTSSTTSHVSTYQEACRVCNLNNAAGGRKDPEFAMTDNVVWTNYQKSLALQVVVTSEAKPNVDTQSLPDPTTNQANPMQESLPIPGKKTRLGYTNWMNCSVDFAGNPGADGLTYMLNRGDFSVCELEEFTVKGKVWEQIQLRDAAVMVIPYQRQLMHGFWKAFARKRSAIVIGGYRR